MPKLHQYKDGHGWFVRTARKNSIATFQLTSRGAETLIGGGMGDGTRFRRAVLWDLWKRGEAYTHGTGPGEIEAPDEGQFELDFSDDPETDNIFFGCSRCGSLDDLHLVEIGDRGDASMGLYCPTCRKRRHENIDSSIPLPLVTRNLLTELMELKRIKKLDASAEDLRRSLEMAFTGKWERLVEDKIQRKEKVQELLFDKEENQKKLL